MAVKLSGQIWHVLFYVTKNSDAVNHLLRYKTPKLDILDKKIDNDTEQLEFA